MSYTTLSYNPHSRKRRRLSHEDYRIACLCPMGVELAPLRAMLDTVHDNLPTKRDHNVYILGEIGQHNVVIATLPSIGNNDSAVTAKYLEDDFPCIRLRLLVGIGGGVPGPQGQNDIRLGDIVVSVPNGTAGGVIQFDRGKQHTNSTFERIGHLNQPPAILNTAVEVLKAKYHQEGSQIERFMNDMVRKNTKMDLTHRFPGREHDHLYQTTCIHVNGDDCLKCDTSQTIERLPRSTTQPKIHYGTIGSSNSLIKNAEERDRLGKEHNILCIEMEAAGLMNSFPCLVIRGICDYADSHKNKRWQPYAATVAAAYAKELLSVITSTERSSLDSTEHMDMPHFSNRSLRDEIELKTQTHKSGTDLQESIDDNYTELANSLIFDRMDARLHNIANALLHTCSWLFDHESFKQWQNKEELTNHKGFFWIKGKPGSGKSTMMKAVLKWAKKNRPNDIHVFYFFNARASTQLEKSTLGLLRSLTHQLLTASSKLRDCFVEQFSWKVKDSSLESWTMVELRCFLIEAVEILKECSLSIFIDALDEGDDADVRYLVALLEEMSLNASGLGASLSICLSSRHYPHITIRNGLSLKLEDEAGHKIDIVKYVKFKVIGDSSIEMEDLRDEICKKSASVFLWVELVAQILNDVHESGGNHKEMFQCLDALPVELDDLFATILQRSDKNLDECISLLMWVLHARRPLTPSELYLATHIRLSDSICSDEPMPDQSCLERYVLDRSRGLTEITKADPPVIQFIHETVRYHFLKIQDSRETIHEPRNVINSTLHAGHTYLVMDCFHYFIRYAFSSFGDEHKFELGMIQLEKELHRKFYAKRSSVQVPRYVSLLEYATNNMFWHVDAAVKAGVSQKVFLRQFWADDSQNLLRWIRFYNTFQRYKTCMLTVKAHLAYIFSEQGLDSLIQELVDDGANVDARGERYGNPLQAACINGHIRSAQVLIEAGLHVNIRGGEFDCPLYAAIRSKSENLMRLLQDHGARASPKNLKKHFFNTVARGFLPGVRLLVDLGADLAWTNNRGKTPLHLAVGNGHVPIAEFLQQRGSSLNIPDTAITSLLTKAVNMPRRSSLETVRWVLRNCHELQTPSDHLDTALLEACDLERESIARLLLQSGANVNAYGCDFGYVLHAACYNRWDTTVQLLIQGGANVNAQSGRFGSALQAACFRCSERITHLLIEAGADVNAEGGEYGNALQAACYQGSKQITQVLIKEGANVNAQGGPYGTALQAACYDGKESIVRPLIEAGADVNAQGGKYGNALQAACVGELEREDVVRLLIEEGANVNARGGQYKSALNAAQLYRRAKSVSLLVGHGADDTDLLDKSLKS